MTAIIAKNLLEGSKILINGVMNGSFKGFDPGLLIFKSITIAGYHFLRSDIGSSISKIIEAKEIIKKDLESEKIFVKKLDQILY